MRLNAKVSRDGIFAILALVLVAFYVLSAGEGFPLDDSWIHQVYGRNLGEHGEWAFVHGEPSAASTAPLYTILLSVGYALGMDYRLWTHFLGVLALTAAAMLAARIAERIHPQKPMTAWAAGLSVLLAWHLLWAAASGMETMLFSMWTLALMFLAWREGDAVPWQASRRGALYGVVAALAVTTRPEGVLLAGLGGLFVMVVLLPGNRRHALTWAVASVVAFGVAIVPYLALNLHLGGGLLPDTSEAKYAQHAPLLTLPYLERIWRLTLPLLAGGQILLLPGIVLMVGLALGRAREHRKTLFLLLPVFWAVGLVMLYAVQLPAGYQHGRYVMPALPGLLVLGAVGTVELINLTRKSMLGRVFARTLAIAAVISFVYFGLGLGMEAYKTDVTIIQEEMVDPAHWIAENLSPEELLAIHDIGAVGYFAPRPILDIAGLLTPDVVPLIGDADGLWELMQERNAQYLMAFTDQLPGKNPDDPRLCFVHQSPGTTSTANGGSKMVIYALAWDGECP